MHRYIEKVTWTMLLNECFLTERKCRKIMNTFLALSRYVQVNQENESNFQLGKLYQRAKQVQCSQTYLLSR